MEISVETELLSNRKHAVVMSPNMAFEVLQTPEGDALFFSIGTDGIFYVTREVRASSTGWTRRNLSSSLSALHGGASVQAKSFDLSQNKQTLAYDLALVLAANGNDHLYLSLDNASSEQGWEDGVSWTAIPFDSTAHAAPSPLVIAGAYLMNLPPKTGTTPVQNCFVDIHRRADDAHKLLDRYYINTKGAPHWTRHTLPIDLRAGSVTSCLGRRPTDSSPGIYTFGTISTERQLIYVPQYTSRDSLVPPRPSRLELPRESSSISSAMNKAGNTNLFLAAAEGIFLYTPENQKDMAEPVLVVPAVFAGQNVIGRVLSLQASTVGSSTAVWALNTQGSLIYMTCPSGKENTPSAWSDPLPICTKVESFAFYLNKSQSEANVVFCHQASGTIQQLTQDPVTLGWQQRSIMLPPSEIQDVISYDAFTTQVTITQDGVPASNLQVHLISDTATAFQVNDMYTVLEPGIPTPMNTDLGGLVTIIQEAASLSDAACFRVRIPGPPVLEVSVDPLAPVMEKLSKIKTGSDFDQFQGLVPAGVPAKDRDGAAQALQRLVDVRNNLPASASSSSAPAARMSAAASQPSSRSSSWAVSFGPDGAKLRDTLQGGSGTVSAAAPSKPRKVAKSGGFLQALVNGFEEIGMEFTQMAEGAWRVLLTIKDVIVETYLYLKEEVNALLDKALEWIKATWEKIKTALLDIFLPWSEIKRTKEVFKTVIRCMAGSIIDGVSDLERGADAFFRGIEEKIEPLKQGKISMGTTTRAAEKQRRTDPVEKNPKANFFSYHLTNGLAKVTGSDKRTPMVVAADKLGELMYNMYKLVDDEVGVLTGAFDDLKHIIDNIHDMDIAEALVAVLSILADVFVKTARNITDKLLKLVKILVSGFFEILDAEIHIPVISALYKEFVGSELSFLDVVCLLGAAPATIIHKVVTGGDSLFRDDAHYRGIIACRSLPELQRQIWGGTVSIQKPGGPQAISEVHIASTLAPEQLRRAVHTNFSQALSESQAQTHAGADANDAIAKEVVKADTDKRVDFGLAVFASVSAALYSYMKMWNIAERQNGGSPSPILEKLLSVYYLGILAPNATSFVPGREPGEWDYANGTMAALCLLKVLVDCVDWDSDVGPYEFFVIGDDGKKVRGDKEKVKRYWGGYASPMLDTVLAFGWAAVITGSLVVKHNKKKGTKASEALAYTYNMFGNLGGMFSALTCEKLDAKWRLGGALGVQIGMQYYAMFAMAQGLTVILE